MKHRLHMGLRVKLGAALYVLGLNLDDVQFDHDPSLAMRPINPETGDTIPPANDPRYIVPRSRADHKRKTFGDHRPLSGDVSQIAKTDRIRREFAEFRSRVLIVSVPDSALEPKRRARAIPSRPFQKRKPHVRTDSPPVRPAR